MLLSQSQGLYSRDLSFLIVGYFLSIGELKRFSNGAILTTKKDGKSLETDVLPLCFQGSYRPKCVWSNIPLLGDTKEDYGGEDNCDCARLHDGD
jgi:hypothetical protein